LIYPIPEDGGLGVHVTLDLNGQVKFGPDVEWIDGVDDISSFQNEYFLISFPLHVPPAYDS
jgi:L-2-hydroxyglutarate oxidase LhgO